MRVATADGLILHGDDTGSGPPVLLVHGLGFHRARWQAQVDALLAAGFRVIRFDLRGFGDTPIPPEPYDIPTLASDVEQVRVAAGVDTLHLVGHSLGGMVALEYALAHPERLRSLTLASTTCHNGRRASAIAEVMSALSQRGFDAAMADPQTAQIVEALASSVAQYSPALLEPLRKITLEPAPERALAWRALIHFSHRWRLQELTCPVLVLHGTADMLMPHRAGEKMAEGITGCRWRSVPGAGHNLPVKHAEVFNEALLSMVQDVEPLHPSPSQR